MIPQQRQIPLFILSGIASAIAFVVSLVGIFQQQIYLPFTPEEILPGVMSQDIISFFASIGVFVCLLAIKRGINRAWLIWLGLVGYLFYAYALYAFDAIYNYFFLGYIAIVGLTIYAAIVFFANVNLNLFQLEERSLPRKIIGVYLLALATLFCFVWLSQIIPALGHGLKSGINTVFVLDLAFFLPLLAIEAVLLFRKKPFAYLLAPAILIKAGTLGLSVFLGELLKPLLLQTFDPFMFGLFAVLGLGSLGLAAITFMQLKIINLHHLACK